jgi:zinc transport system permease protein
MPATLHCQFVVWQKQSYFGATLAHTALLGVALGLLLEINWQWSVAGIALLTGWAVHSLLYRSRLSADTLLGMLAHSTLAVALVLLSYSTVQVDLNSFLFGDILSITPLDTILALGLLLAVSLFMRFSWRALLNITLNPELAFAEGIPVQRTQLSYVLLLSLVIALSIKIVGVLLITSLLILPPAAARHFSRTPEAMLLGSLFIAAASVLGGLALSWQLDWPTGPAIVVVATLLFILALPFRR